MVTLDKTGVSIAVGKMRAAINQGLRRNNLLALSLEFSERAYDAEVKAHEARTAELRGEWGSVLTDHKECENDGCHTPVRKVEDFCSEACWEEWHAKYDPETLAAVTR